MRQSYEISEIAAMLAQRAEDVAHRYAPAADAYRDGSQFWTLNPGRVDRRVGSFVIHVAGPRAGHFKDFSSGDRGDMIDLIRLALGCDAAEALREARRFLGLAHESPEDIRRRKEALARTAERNRKAEAEARAAEERRSRQAHALWLSARTDLLHSPVAAYLAGREIDLAELPRLPGVLRFEPSCYYAHAAEVDPETGEILRDEVKTRLPAMVALMIRGSRPVALHRTYLAPKPGGGWGKAAVPKAKKVLGPVKGAAIRLWAGLGPRGGHAVPLNKAGPGQHVHLCEGIEDGLVAALVKPEARVLVAYSLDNIAALAAELPANVSTVTIIGDRDGPENTQAAAELQRAIAAHAAAGREVRLWLPPEGSGCKDLNDWWIKRRRDERAERGAA